jgi:hypothetical protein
LGRVHLLSTYSKLKETEYCAGWELWRSQRGCSLVRESIVKEMGNGQVRSIIASRMRMMLGANVSEGTSDDLERNMLI